MLSQSSFVSGEASGVLVKAFQFIMKFDVDGREDLRSNAVLAGGAAVFAGVGERMTEELTAFAPATVKFKVVAPPERKYSVWIGGPILS